MTAILVGLCGVLLIVRPGTEGFTVFSVYALIAVGFVTVRDLVTRRVSGATHSLMVTFITSLGLLIAFTFSGATSRFEARRHLLTEEANAIGTAYLRLDLLPATAQPELRRMMRAYVDARMAGGDGGDDVRLQNAIWTAA